MDIEARTAVVEDRVVPAGKAVALHSIQVEIQLEALDKPVDSDKLVVAALADEAVDSDRTLAVAESADGTADSDHTLVVVAVVENNLVGSDHTLAAEIELLAGVQLLFDE